MVRQALTTVLSLFYAVLVLSLLVACTGTAKKANTGSDLAIANISLFDQPGWDNLSVNFVPTDGASFSMTPMTFTRSQTATITVKIPPGAYTISLNYFSGQTMVYAANVCASGVRNDQQVLKTGENPLTIIVCQVTNSGSSGSGSSGGTSSGGTPSNHTTFYVSNGKIYDPSGQEFIIRGISNPHAYYLSQALNALPRIKALGFNTVRIIWCADTLQVGGRCDANAIHTAQDLKNIFTELRQLQLVAVLNLQNATGSDDPANLTKMVDYLVSPSIKTILQQNQDMTIINVANEWYGTWDNNSIYLTSYQTAITRLRQAGLPHLLMIDSAGWGQEFSSIQQFGKQLVAFDSNIVLSTHMYEVFNTSNTVSDAFQYIRSNSLPWLVGEFGCSNGPSKSVACDTIMKEASKSGSSYGYIAWSFAGNNSDLSDLNITSDWMNLTSWGTTLISGAGGITATAKPACFWSASSCH